MRVYTLYLLEIVNLQKDEKGGGCEAFDIANGMELLVNNA